MKTLIIVDVQNDFLPGGALEVPGSDHVVSEINRIQSDFDLVVATQDWHPKNHMSFASNHPGKKPFDVIKVGHLEQILWPPHCVQESQGAAFPPTLKTARIETIFRKGTDPTIDSYSAFFDNEKKKTTGLAGYLREKKVKHIHFCGLAGDICVYYTIMDALSEGFECTLVKEATHPLDPVRYEELLNQLSKKGVRAFSSGNL